MEKTRRAISLYFLPREVFQNDLGQMDIGKECTFSLVTCAFMTIPMTSELMALSNYFAHKRWVALRDPTQGKEGCLGICLGQQSQQALNIALNPTLTRLPLCSGNEWRKGGYLEVVLYVDRERVGNGGGENALSYIRSVSISRQECGPMT